MTHIQRDFVNELHGIAAEHYRHNSPIDFSTQSFQFTRGCLVVFMAPRLLYIPICLVEIATLDGMLTFAFYGFFHARFIST